MSKVPNFNPHNNQSYSKCAKTENNCNKLHFSNFISDNVNLLRLFPLCKVGGKVSHVEAKIQHVLQPHTLSPSDVNAWDISRKSLLRVESECLHNQIINLIGRDCHN